MVASGTAFGEIIVWTYALSPPEAWIVSHLRTFSGHNGSIFGVSISDNVDIGGRETRLIASCSDDRIIKLWDIGVCNSAISDANHAFGSAETGFGTNNEATKDALSSHWAHLSRVWGVQFVARQENARPTTLKLLSRGEDGACQLWSINCNTDIATEVALTPEANDRHHHGKNAWSLCHYIDRRGLVVHTGGADGQIISRKFDIESGDQKCLPPISVLFKTITGSSAGLKNYVLVGPGECIANTDQGQLYSIKADGADLKSALLLKVVSKGGLGLCLLEKLDLVLVAPQQEGLFSSFLHSGADVSRIIGAPTAVSWLQYAGSFFGDVAYHAVVVLAKGELSMLWLSCVSGSVHVSCSNIEIPDGFVATSVHYNQQHQLLLLGSRSGALAFYRNVTPTFDVLQITSCLRRVHGNDSVTSITVLPRYQDGGDTTLLDVFTTGRDGTYAIRRIPSIESLGMMEEEPMLIHLASPPFGPNVEGAYLLLKDGPNGQAQDLMLYGFRSTSFVVRNETQQTEVLSVECGGAHRSWSYKDVSGARTFVWTKAGTFNVHQSSDARHKIVQRGGHGREIKATAISPLVAGKHLRKPRIMATGAEDTDIRLFALSQLPSDAKVLGDFRQLALLQGHTTGIQHLQFSECGLYLFSSAGIEDFFVWRLSHNIPLIEVGTVLWDIMPMTPEDDDVRIMSFDVRSEATETQAESFVIAMAYSNGKTKIIRYTPATARKRGMFDKLQELVYGTFCLMQAAFLDPFIIRDELPLSNHVLIAGTNGFLNLIPVDLYLLPTTSTHNSGMLIHKVHQSSILSFSIFSITPFLHLIATGGDDNALGLTVIALPICNPSTTSIQARTLLTPTAHAAAITALKVTTLQHGLDKYIALVVTASNDQRVKVWRVELDLNMMPDADESGDAKDGDPLMEGVKVELVGRSWTGVADVSGLEIVKRDGEDEDGVERRSVLVVGVGMEMLDLEWIEC
jgi:WD repeat-containing protein 6